jgi:N12 class adenine-specific DNA methylase
MFRQTDGRQSPRRGVSERAENPEPSQGYAAETEAPVWRRYVGNSDFQEANRGAVAAENARIREAEAVRRAAGSGGGRIPDWKVDDGRLLFGGEEQDPEQWMNDPEAGRFAEEALFQRDRKSVATEMGMLGLSLSDPTDRRKLTDKQREDFEAELGYLKDEGASDEMSRARMAEIESALKADRSRLDDETKLHRLKKRKFLFDNGGVEWWRQDREERAKDADPVRAADEVAAKGKDAIKRGDARMAELEKEAAEIAARKQRGLRTDEVDAVREREAEIRAEVAGLKQGREEAKGAISEAAADAGGRIDRKFAPPEGDPAVEGDMRPEVFGLLTKDDALSPTGARAFSDANAGTFGQVAKGVVGGMAERGSYLLGLIGEKFGMDAPKDVGVLNDVLSFDDLREAAKDPKQRDKGADYIIKNDLIPYFEKQGITDGREMTRIMRDAVRSQMWDSTSDEKVRRMSDGTLAINPALVVARDEKEGIAAIDRVRGISAEAKEAEKEKFRQARSFAAEAMDAKARAYDADYKAHAEKMNAAGVTDPEKVFFSWDGLDRNWVESSWDWVRDTVAQSGRNMYNTIVRAPAAGLAQAVGAEGAAEDTARRMIESQRKSGFVSEIAAARGQGGGLFGTTRDLGTTVVDMVPMFTGAKAGRLLAGGAEAGAARKILGNITAGASVYGYAGMQGYASVMQTALEKADQAAKAEGRELNGGEIDAAIGDAQWAGLGNGLQTMLFAKLLGGGSEKAALEGLASKTGMISGRELLAVARAKYGKDGVAAAIRETLPEMKAFAKQVGKASGLGFADEAVEEGLNQFTEGVITKLSGVDADKSWDDIGQETWQGAWMGGVVGGGLSGIQHTFARNNDRRRAHAALEKAWAERTVGEDEQTRRQRVALAAREIDPEAGSELTVGAVDLAREVVGDYGTTPAVAEINRQIETARQEYAAARDTGDTEAAAKIDGDITRMQKEREKVAAADLGDAAIALQGLQGRYEEARSAFEAAQGAGDMESAAAAMGEVRKALAGIGLMRVAAGKPLAEVPKAERMAMGVNEDGSPISGAEVAIELAADGSPIILETAIAELRDISPRAADRIKLSEAEARKRAVERAEAGATPTESPQTEDTPTDSLPEGTASPAEEAGAAAPPAAGTRKFRVTSEKGRSIEIEAANENDAADIGADSFEMGERVSSVEEVAAVSETPAGAQPEPKPKPKPGARQAAKAEATKAIARLKKGPLKGLIDIGRGDDVRGAAGLDSRIVIDPERIGAEAEAAGLTANQTKQWVAKIIDEEIRHHANIEAARALHAESGSELGFEEWLADHYGRVWQEEFVGAGLDEMVRSIYGDTLDSLPEWKRAMEGIRIISQKLATGTPTETARLWAKIGAETRRLLLAALEKLKGLKGNLSPGLRREVDALDAKLKELQNEQSRGDRKTDGQKPPTGGEADGDGNRKKPRGRKKGSSGKGKTPGTGSRPTGGAAGGIVGQRVDFRDAETGDVLAGVVRVVNSSGQALVALDSPDAKGRMSRLVASGDFRVIRTSGNGQSEGDVAEKPSQPESAPEGIESLIKLYSQHHQARVRREMKDGDPERLEQALKQWEPEAQRERVEGFIREIDAKNVNALRGWNNGMHDGVWKLFRARTGLKVPKTQKGIEEVIRQYVGEEAYQAEVKRSDEARANRQEEAKKKQAEIRLQTARTEAKEQPVGTPDGDIPGDQWVDQMIADGWRIMNISTGAVPQYAFTKDGNRIKINREQAKPLIAYARELEAQGMIPEIEEDVGEVDPEVDNLFVAPASNEKQLRNILEAGKPAMVGGTGGVRLEIEEKSVGGWVLKATRFGQTITKGRPYPAGAGWSKEEAISNAIKEARFQVDKQAKAKSVLDKNSKRLRDEHFVGIEKRVRDEVLAEESVKNALANSDEQNVRIHVEATTKKVVGRLMRDRGLDIQDLPVLGRISGNAEAFGNAIFLYAINPSNDPDAAPPTRPVEVGDWVRVKKGGPREKVWQVNQGADGKWTFKTETAPRNLTYDFTDEVTVDRDNRESVQSELPGDFELVAPGEIPRVLKGQGASTLDVWAIVAPGGFTVGQGATPQEAYEGYLQWEAEEEAPAGKKPATTSKPDSGSPKLTAAEEKAKNLLFDAFDGMVDGLQAAPLIPENYRQSPPPDRLPAFQKAAQALIEADVKTPEALAAFLEKIAPGKLRGYSEFLWRQVNSFLMGDNVETDWPTLYGGIDTGGGKAEIETEPEEDNETERRGDGSGTPDAEPEESLEDREQDGDLLGDGEGSDAKGKGASSRKGSRGGGRGGRGNDSGGDRDAEGGGDQSGEVDGDRRGDGSPDGDGTRPEPRDVDPDSPEADFRIDDAFSMPKTARERISANLAAIDLLRVLEREERNATKEEKAILAKYSGWGSFKEAFNTIKQQKWEELQEQIAQSGEWQADYIRRSDEYVKLKSWRDNYGELHDQLREILEDSEFRSMAKSVMNAHYTNLPVVDSMWRMVERLGFKGGSVLETSAGSGFFIGRQPEHLAEKSRWSAVELDEITSRVLSKLYPQARVNGNSPAPDRVVDGQGFQKSKIPNNSIDLVIGNFPFHQTGPGESDREFGQRLNLHNYFFARSLSKLKPGGLIVAITSASTMDNNLVQRELLVGRAELVGAIRLPNTAFKGSAGTEVTTDILILRKKDGTLSEHSHQWLNTVQIGTDTVTMKRAGKKIDEWLGEIPSEWQPVDEALREPWAKWAVKKPKTGKARDAFDEALGDYLSRNGWGLAGARIEFNVPITVNQYFQANPEMALGRHALSGSMYRANEYTLESDGRDIGEALDAVVERLPEWIVGRSLSDELASLGKREADANDREGSTLERDGQIYQVIDGELIPLRWDVEVLETKFESSDILKGKQKLRKEYEDIRDELDPEKTKAFIEKQLAKLPPKKREALEKRVETELERRIKVYRSWSKVRDALIEVIDAERGDSSVSDAKLKDLRKKLNESYDAHVKLFGPINKRKRNPLKFLSDDQDAPLVESLEDEEVDRLDENGDPVYRYVKRPIFTKKVLDSVTPPETAESVEEAVGISLGFLGKISPEYIARLVSRPQREVESEIAEKELAFIDPESGKYELADMYLSGEVRTKLEKAEQAEKESPGAYTANIEALKKVQPPRRPTTSISVVPGARWIRDDIYTRFVAEVLGRQYSVKYVKEANVFRITEDRSVQLGSELDEADSFDVEGAGRMRIFDAVMNMRKIVIKDDDGEVMPEQTAMANTKAEEMRQKFAEWVKGTESTVVENGKAVPIPEAIEDDYNNNVSGVIPPNFKGDWITLPGQSGEIYIKNRPHRKAVLARMLLTGYGMMAHGVGSGKTYNQIALAMEMRRLGKARKPLILVQNSTIRQFAASFMKAYPDARILVADSENFSSKKRARFQARMATGDYDAIILTHSNVSLIGHSQQSIRDYMARAMDQLDEALRNAPEGSQEQRDIQAARDNLQEKLNKMLEKAAKRAGKMLTWEQLGVDALIVDEAHEFKNTPVVTRMGRVKNMPTGQGADRAVMMQMKVASVQARNDGRNVFFATGTPITNTMAEAYTMLQYIAPRLLEHRGINNFDDFATMFGRTVSDAESTWRGEIEYVERFAKFVNGPELINLVRTVFDVALGNENLGLRVPRLKGGAPRPVLVEPTEANEIFNDWVIDTAAAFDAIENKREAFEENPWMQAIPIMTMQAGMAQAIDPRLVNPDVPDEPGSKVNKAVEEIVRIYNEGKDRRTAQVVFSDLSNSFSTMLLRQFNGDPFEEYTKDSPRVREMRALEAEIMAIPEEEKNTTENKKKLTRYRELVSQGFNLFDDIKEKLIARGIPASEIFIASSDIDREKLQPVFEKVNDGRVRVIMGSSARLGVGVNIQERLAALHNLSPPRDFKPAMMEQRLGRLLRQGNLFRDWADDAFADEVARLGGVAFDQGKAEKRREAAESWLEENDTEDPQTGEKISVMADQAAARFDIEALNYGLKMSMDSAVYSMMTAKQGFIEQILMGENVEDEFDDPASEEANNFAMMAAETMGNEDMKLRVKLRSDLRELNNLRNSHNNDIWRLQDTIRRGTRAIEAFATYETEKAREIASRYEGVFSRVKRTVNTTKGAVAKAAGEEIDAETAKEKTTIEKDAPVYRFGDEEIDMGKPGGKITDKLNGLVEDMAAEAGARNSDSVTRDFFINGVRFEVVASFWRGTRPEDGSYKVVIPEKAEGFNLRFQQSFSSDVENPGLSMMSALRKLTEPGNIESDIRWHQSNEEYQRKNVKEAKQKLAKKTDFPREKEYREKISELRKVEARILRMNQDPKNHRYYRSLSRLIGEDATKQALGVDVEAGFPEEVQASQWKRLALRMRFHRYGITGETEEQARQMVEMLRNAVRRDVEEARAANNNTDDEFGEDFVDDRPSYSWTGTRLFPMPEANKGPRILQLRRKLAGLEKALARYDEKFDGNSPGDKADTEAFLQAERDLEEAEYSDELTEEEREKRVAELRKKVADLEAKDYYRDRIEKRIQETRTELALHERKKAGQSTDAKVPYGRFRGDDGMLRAAPLNETRENIERLREKGREAMPNAAIEKEARDEQEAFRKEGKVIGDPDLAGFSDDEYIREETDVYTQIYKHEKWKETRAQWRAEGSRIAADENTTEEKWLTAAYDSGGERIEPEDVIAAQILMEKRLREAKGDREKMADAGVLVMGYRKARSMQARVLAAGVDIHRTPAERHRAYIAGALFNIPPKLMRSIEGRARTPEQARKAVRAAIQQRLDKIDRELKKSGVTLERIINGEAFLSLNRTKAFRETIKDMNQAEKQAIQMIVKAVPVEDIKRRTGLSQARLIKLRDETAAKLREKMRGMVASGMRLEDIKDAIQREGLSAAPLSEEDVERELTRIIEVGFGLNDDFLKAKRKKRRKQEKEPEDPEDAIRTAAQKTAQRHINRLAKSQSDTLEWTKKKRDELDELIRAHIKKPVADFRHKAMTLGATENQARLLDKEAVEERKRVENIRKVRDEWRKEKRRKDMRWFSYDWSRPEFTDGLDTYTFASKDRAALMQQLEALRALNAAAGKIAGLKGEKKSRAIKHLAQIDAILNKYGTDSETILRDRDAMEHHRFDIHDRQQVQMIARTISAIDADIVDKGAEYYYSSMLSGIQTMLVNATTIIPATWEATVGRGIEAALNLISRDPMAATFGEARYLKKALGPMWARALSNAATTWGTEMPVFEEDILGREPDMEAVFEGRWTYGSSAIAGKKGRVIRIPSRILLATDEAVKTLIAVSEVGAMAYRLGRAQGLKPGTPEFDKFLKRMVNTVGSPAWQLAAKKAYDRTFTAPLVGQKDMTKGPDEKTGDTEGNKVPFRGQIGDVASWAAGQLTHALGHKPENIGAKALVMGLRVLFFPFQRVPFNIIRKGIRHTLNPVSLMDIGLLTIANTKFRNGRFTMNARGEKAEIIERLAQQMQGGLLMALLWGLAEGDEDDLDKPLLITGSRPPDFASKGERELGYRMGLGPFTISIKLPSGKRRTFNYGRLEPAATVLGATMDTLRELKFWKRGQEEFGNALWNASLSLKNQLSDKTFLRGFSDLQRLVSDPDVTGSKWAASRMGVLMPNIIRQPIREFDTVYREAPDNFMDQLSAQLWPIGQGSPRMDPYGEENKKEGNRLARTVDFTEHSVIDPANPYDEMLFRYARKHPKEESGSDLKPYFPTSPGRSWTDPISGEKREMTDTQYRKFAELAGKRGLSLMKRERLNLKNPTIRDIEAYKKALSRARSDTRRILYRNPAWRKAD